MIERRRAIKQRGDETEDRLLEHVAGVADLAVVEAPPGSGKTRLLLKAVARAVKLGARVAVAAQTNTQADDICRRLAADHPRVRGYRFASSKHSAPADFPPSVSWIVDKGDLPTSPSVVVGTSAKWGLVTLTGAFDLLIVEEAWQLSWADFILLTQVSARVILIGDPGQIPPVVSIDTSRWETSPNPPHLAAPSVILSDPSIQGLRLSLPATHRLPEDTTAMIRSFYRFPFESWASAGDRRVIPTKKSRGSADATIDLLQSGSTAALLLPTPEGGPPLEQDSEVAQAVVGLVDRLLTRECTVEIDGNVTTLAASDIGICATHRVMNGEISRLLPASLRRSVRVDTPERWQGLQRKAMVVVHPLSGVTRPSTFDLETGRLCVMASRHQAGLILVSRDHVPETLDGHLPLAEQAVGRPDVAGEGHARNLAFWGELERGGRLVRQ